MLSADTLKKLEISPNSETYLLNILRFIGVLDSENKKTNESAQIFNKHEDSEFQSGFAKLVEKSYHELFALHSEGAWSLPLTKLISFFRNHDSTSDIVGKRQATTFQTLASLSGKIPASPAQTAPSFTSAGGKATKQAKPLKFALAKAGKSAAFTNDLSQAHVEKNRGSGSPMALTVRVEINLPAGGDQKTYDAIFKSIRENLLNGQAV